MFSLAPLGLIFLTALAIRWSYRHRPELRLKSGEARAEARLVLLGTYRVYTWLVLITLGFGVAAAALGTDGPWWLSALTVLFGILQVMTAHAIYWRLGYDWRRWIFALAHLTIMFGLSEYLFAIRHDLSRFIERP